MTEQLNYDRLKQRRSGARAGFGWKPKEGTNRIRVLPPHSSFIGNWGAMGDIAVLQKLHYFKIEGRRGEVSLCLEELKQRCPACEAWRTWRKSEDPGMKELARQISPSDRYLMNIIDINNEQEGVQYWGSNYTCWDKILEIAANPAWGNVLDPLNGVDFDVNLTPSSKSRTGYNSYSVMPMPTRTSVTEILAKDPDWRAKLDALAEQTEEAKELEEFYALLEEMGFPPPKGRTPAAAPVAPAPPAAAPVAPAPPAAAPVAPTTGVHYDPGPDYAPKFPVETHPPDAPRCFGDYQPAIHRCQPCPQQTACQMKMLGIH